jgi:hypothetical protein
MSSTVRHHLVNMLDIIIGVRIRVFGRVPAQNRDDLSTGIVAYRFAAGGRRVLGPSRLFRFGSFQPFFELLLGVCASARRMCGLGRTGGRLTSTVMFTYSGETDEPPAVSFLRVGVAHIPSDADLLLKSAIASLSDLTML